MDERTLNIDDVITDPDTLQLWICTSVVPLRLRPLEQVVGQQPPKVSLRDVLESREGQWPTFDRKLGQSDLT